MKNKLLALLLSLSVLSSAHASSTPAAAAGRQLNIITTFGTSEVGVYGVPNAFMGRYTKIAEKVADVYQSRFSINLNFLLPDARYVVESCADACRILIGQSNYDSFCTHIVSDSACSNNGPYHCTNAGVIKRDVFPSDDITTQGYQMHITATRVCSMDNGTHKSLNGMWYSDGFMLIRDTDYTKVDDPPLDSTTYEIIHAAKTVAHEIGHAYGVEDHYSSTSSNNGSPYCIWGEYKDVEAIANNLQMCTACSITILSNGGRYNHS